MRAADKSGGLRRTVGLSLDSTWHIHRALSPSRAGTGTESSCVQVLSGVLLRVIDLQCYQNI